MLIEGSPDPKTAHLVGVLGVLSGKLALKLVFFWSVLLLLLTHATQYRMPPSEFVRPGFP